MPVGVSVCSVSSCTRTFERQTFRTTCGVRVQHRADIVSDDMPSNQSRLPSSARAGAWAELSKLSRWTDTWGPTGAIIIDASGCHEYHCTASQSHVS